MATSKTKKTRPAKAKSKTLTLQYVRSAIGTPEKHKLVVRGLGFRKLNQVVVRPDTPAVRGMVARIPHLVTIIKAE